MTRTIGKVDYGKVKKYAHRFLLTPIDCSDQISLLDDEDPIITSVRQGEQLGEPGESLLPESRRVVGQCDGMVSCGFCGMRL